MAFAMEKRGEGRVICLPAVFIDKYMYNADGNFVKVYITGLRQCNLNKTLSNAEIANLLGLIESDVMRAWRYWENLGVVQIKNGKNGENEIIFRDLDVIEAKKMVAVETRPVYSIDEIYAHVRGNTKLEDLYGIASKILQKPLSTTDTMIIYSLYDYYRFPIDVIPLLLSFCMNNNKKSMRQIERVAQSWVDKNITTAEKAEEYLKKAEEYNSKISALKKAMGIYDRKFTPTEKKYIDMWLEQMVIPVELIAYAYDVTIINTGKLSVTYMNRILQDWHAAGLKTPAQANKYRQENKPVPEKKPATKSTGFTNFEQRKDYDFDALENRAFSGSNKK